MNPARVRINVAASVVPGRRIATTALATVHELIEAHANAQRRVGCA